MQSYFFIPGTLLHKIDSILHHGADEVIIDLEDAVGASDRKAIIDALQKDSHYQQFWIRLFLRENFDEDLLLENLSSLLDKGYRKFILPKLKNVSELKEIIIKTKATDNISYIILIEHPLLLAEIEEILKEYHPFIHAIAIGSHDLIAFMGGKHQLINLEYPRNRILYAAKAYGVKAIDLASMDIDNPQLLKKEIIDGFEKGFDGKFFIHPSQLTVFNEIDFFDENEKKWAKKVVALLDDVGVKDEFKPIVVDGKIVEKPHINKAKFILKKRKGYEGQ